MNQDLLEKRYLQPGEETWEDIVHRVAGHAASNDQEREEFFQTIYNGYFFPSRMPYMGTEYPFASSCFVMSVEDSLIGILDTLSKACQVQKFGGGVGFNFSNLRPQGDLIQTSRGEASGPVSFMKLYHSAMEVVHRAGRKHAAQMGVLNVDHPDIYKFIQCKDREGAFWTFNLSIGITDDFIDAVKNDTRWDLKFDGRIYDTVEARELWEYIVWHAHHNGDPGLIFLDTVNRNNKYPEEIEASNPCGEQMLPPFVSCNLGSIDLSQVVDGHGIDWDLLGEVTRIGVRFLDGSIESAYWPVEEIAEKTRKYRNIGLGVMGWADLLLRLGIPYDTEEAVSLASKVMSFINNVASDESNGKNTTLTSIAPTGSISLLAGCSSGVEPLFGIVTTKNTYVGSYNKVHPIFEEIAKDRGFYSEQLIEDIGQEGSIQRIPEIPNDIKKLFKTTHDIHWEWHIKHQAAFQAHVDNAVSKTINLSNDAATQDVGGAFLMAYDTGCKSITVYREGSRQVEVIDTKTQDRDVCPNCDAILYMKDGEKQCVTCNYKPPKESQIVKDRRPKMLNGRTYEKETPEGKAYITINDNGEGRAGPFEVFLNVGKAGSSITAISEAIGRLISLILRIPSPLPRRERLVWIIDELIEIGGGRSLGFGADRVKSLPDGLAQVLVEYLQLEEVDNLTDICPDCGESSFIAAEGCRKCLECGFSEC